MLTTVAEATQKMCPHRVVPICRGDGCMMFRFAREPVLSRALRLNYQAIERLFSIPIPKNFTSDVEWNAYYRATKVLPVQNQHFNYEGWQADSTGPQFDSDTGEWFLKVSRTEDVKAQGYCGLAGRP